MKKLIKLSKAEKEAIRKVTSEAGKASAALLTKAQLIKRASDAGKASGKARAAKARGKNAQKKDLQSGGKI